MNVQDHAAQFLTKRQFAALCGVSGRTVCNWTAAGMPHLRPGPRKTLYDPAEAQAWVRDRFTVTRKPSTSARARMEGGAR